MTVILWVTTSDCRTWQTPQIWGTNFLRKLIWFHLTQVTAVDRVWPSHKITNTEKDWVILFVKMSSRWCKMTLVWRQIKKNSWSRAPSQALPADGWSYSFYRNGNYIFYRNEIFLFWHPVVVASAKFFLPLFVVIVRFRWQVPSSPPDFLDNL